MALGGSPRDPVNPDGPYASQNLTAALDAAHAAYATGSGRAGRDFTGFSTFVDNFLPPALGGLTPEAVAANATQTARQGTANVPLPIPLPLCIISACL